MKKNFLQTLLVVVLSVIGVSQCWAETNYSSPFNFVSYNHTGCANSEFLSITYNQLNGYNGYDFEAGGVDDCGKYVSFIIPKNTYAAHKAGLMMRFSYSPSVEPYTKVTLTYNYKLTSYENGLASNFYATTYLYQFDSQDEASATAVEFRGCLSNKEVGKSHRLAYITNTASGAAITTGSYDFVFDNLAGSATKSYTKCLLVVFCEEYALNEPVSAPCFFFGGFKSTDHSFAYTYRKVITFNGNGSTGGSMDAQNIDDKGNLTTNAFTRTGYTFNGWNTKADGTGTAYTNGQAITVTASNKGAITLYAQWTPIVYNITYNVNEGSEITEHKTYTIETETFALPEPTKEGYTFGGWFTNEACTEGYTTQITNGSTGNKTFYAKWNENVVSDGSNKDNVDDAAAEVNTALSTWVAECEGGKAINLTINRTIYKDGYYNTLCLPFDMSAAQIAATFGDYKELKQFQSATVQGSGASRSIVIEVENATTIEAGKAYLISFEKGTDITTLTFNNVIVSTTAAPEEPGTLAYQGILAPYQLPYGNQNYLFLGEKNTLYWPIDDGTFMKGFRAYFKVNTDPAQAPYRPGMRAAFGARQTPTDLSPAVSGQEVRKLLEQGRVVIVNKGVKYNMNGATVQ